MRMFKANPANSISAGMAIALLISNAGSASAQTKSLNVSSSDLAQGSTVAQRNIKAGSNASPQLSWSEGPISTKSYAISCTDPDAPGGTWWHWIIFNIPSSTKHLNENVEKIGTLTDGSVQGSNDFKKIGYDGPSPPPGKLHHYEFKVMALDSTLSLKPGCDKEAFKSALKGHILAEGQLTGTFQK
jgi:Raf kinase inhibitor-like YbhB/YbcL family protein